MIQTLVFLLLGSVSFAAEVSDPVVKADFSLLKGHLEDQLFALCSWDEKIFTTPTADEYFTEMPCRDGSYSYKFGLWLNKGTSTTFRAESYALSDASKWFCAWDGELIDAKVFSEGSCTQLE